MKAKNTAMIGMILLTMASMGAEIDKPCKSPESRKEEARKTLNEYKSGDRDWKQRMEGLVKLVGMGNEITPLLAEEMQDGSSLAAQAVALSADPAARPAFEKALQNSSSRVRAYAVQGLSLLGRIESGQEPYRSIAAKDRDPAVRYGMSWAFERDDSDLVAARIQEALRTYDLAQMDTARLDEPAPDFSLTDAFGKTYRLSDFRGKKSVVLRFYREPI